MFSEAHYQQFPTSGVNSRKIQKNQYNLLHELLKVQKNLDYPKIQIIGCRSIQYI